MLSIANVVISDHSPVAGKIVVYEIQVPGISWISKDKKSSRLLRLGMTCRGHRPTNREMDFSTSDIAIYIHLSVEFGDPMVAISLDLCLCRSGKPRPRVWMTWVVTEGRPGYSIFIIPRR